MKPLIIGRVWLWWFGWTTWGFGTTPGLPSSFVIGPLFIDWIKP